MKLQKFWIGMIVLGLAGCATQQPADLSELDNCIQKSTDGNELVITVKDAQSNTISLLSNWKEEQTQYGVWTYVKEGDQEVKAKNTFVEILEYRPEKQKTIFMRKIGNMLGVEGINETDHRGTLPWKVVLEEILYPAVVEENDSIALAEGYELMKKGSKEYEIQSSDEEGWKYTINLDDEDKIKEIKVYDDEEIVKTAEFDETPIESDEEKKQIQEILNEGNLSDGELIEDFQEI